jgi:hypothetical protein
MNQKTVWIFHGERAQFASAVFTSEADALSWASTHRVSGIVTEYPVGDGCYDLAVARRSRRRNLITERLNTSLRSHPAGHVTSI